MFVMVKLTIKVIKIIGMAFVTTASRKQQFATNPQFPSPAHYQLKQGETNRECAPFRSTSVRKINLQGTQQILPGPGHYEISKEIIKPKISAYVHNDSIVIKINSTGSPQFKSDTVRFKDKPVPKHAAPLNVGLQPQTSKDTNNQTKKNSRLKIHKLPQIQRSRFASIPSKSRILNEDEPEYQAPIETKQPPTPGPGFYQSLLSKHINSKGTVWGKDSSKRFLKASTIQVGPGQYSIPNTVQLKNAKEQSANFKSGTARSFIDSIMYQSSVEYVVNQRQRENFKSPEPAPGQYDYPESFANSNKIQSPFQSFGSVVDRFVTKQMKAKPYNQFYNVGQYFGNNNSFNKIKSPFNSQTQRNPSFLDSSMHSRTPGPGQYYQQKLLPQRKKGKNIQMFGSLTERTQAVKEKQSPQQSEDEKEREGELLKSRFKQLQHESFTFKSTTNRQCFGNIQSATKLGQYDLSYYDVSTKLEKQRICLENLKKIQVVKPPFESNMSRFPHYISPERIKRTKHSQLPQINHNQNSEQQVKHLSIGGKIGKEKRFAKEKKGKDSPEVGTYNCTIGWDKPSFNVRFQQK